MMATAASATPPPCSPLRSRNRSVLPVVPTGLLSPAIRASPLCLRSSVYTGLPVRKARRCWSGRPGVGAVVVRASSSAEGVSDTSERWLLEPIGDGDCRHIGFRVPMPSAFELASNVVTVGRLPEKADMVIPVATVSGVHARLEKKNGTLLVTDLDSTNGTFINEKKLRPGATAPVAPGSFVTFGDTHLAIFRVSKLQVEDTSKTLDDSEVEAVTEFP